jgi:hypothetical protein
MPVNLDDDEAPVNFTADEQPIDLDDLPKNANRGRDEPAPDQPG